MLGEVCEIKGFKERSNLMLCKGAHGSHAQGFQQVCERVRTHHQVPLLHIKIEFAGKGLREFLLYI